MLNFHTSLNNFRSHINDLKLSPQEFNKKKLCDRKCDRKRMSKNKEKKYIHFKRRSLSLFIKVKQTVTCSI